MVSDRNRWRRTLWGTLALLASVAVVLFGVFWLIDFFWLHVHAPGDPGPLGRLLALDPGTMQSALGNLAQIIAAVLGIAITVVSIVVQLAANRYTPRVADMFFRDRTNLAVMGFFVVACIDAIWVSLVVSRDYIPLATVLATVAIVTASLLALIPYFAYVFDFLDPEKVIARLGEQTLRKALGRGRRAEANVAARQAQTATSMEQLADVAVNAVSHQDKVIAADAIGALRRVIVDYLRQKNRLPSAWFAIGPVLRNSPDLVALAPASVADLATARVWVEWKGLRQLHGIFCEALKTMPQMAHVVAIETRYVGEAALGASAAAGVGAGVAGSGVAAASAVSAVSAVSDRSVLSLAVKFMNTYLRAALNARDVGTAYNVLNQYRQLVEAMLHALPGRGGEVADIASHFKYYAQLAQGMGLSFVAETAAYDLAALCEIAHAIKSPAHDRLLGTLLEIDKEAETTAQEKALRGVRKAQAKLAAYYLKAGAEPRARQIYEDMALESTERLRSIRDEMLSITSKNFWEIIDRATNFDYVDDDRKLKLGQFFGWFPDLAAGGGGVHSVGAGGGR